MPRLRLFIKRLAVALHRRSARGKSDRSTAKLAPTERQQGDSTISSKDLPDDNYPLW